MWSVLALALAGVISAPLPSPPELRSPEPGPPQSCVVPAVDRVAPDPCRGRPDRPLVACTLPVVFRGTVVPCEPGRPESRIVPVPTR